MAAALGLGACAGLGPHPGALASLDGTGWTLATLDEPITPGTGSVTLNFDKGRVSGSDGCNRYGAAYAQQAPDTLTFATSRMTSTQMACPPAIEQKAAAFARALERTRIARVNGVLALQDDAGQTVATLNPLPTGLAGSRWQVSGVNNGRQAVVSVAADTELSVHFGQDGQLSGSAGCNAFSGRFDTTGRIIQVGPIATTRKLCTLPAPVMEQETQFLNALQSASTWRRDGNRLELRTGTGALALTLNAADGRIGIAP